MNNKCKDCGKCCLDTEMILSQRDIKLIIDNYHNIINENDFAFMNNFKHYQLKNKQGHCVFLEPSLKICKIYEHRPQGCRFYPLIFDSNRIECKLDEDCPRTSLFYKNKERLMTTCQDLKRYLKTELKIAIK
jgi:Fe-S-cluster containining protein